MICWKIYIIYVHMLMKTDASCVYVRTFIRKLPINPNRNGTILLRTTQQNKNTCKTNLDLNVAVTFVRNSMFVCQSFFFSLKIWKTRSWLSAHKYIFLKHNLFSFSLFRNRFEWAQFAKPYRIYKLYLLACGIYIYILNQAYICNYPINCCNVFGFALWLYI